MHEQSKISALLMTKNSTTVFMDSDGKSQFASAIGAVSIERENCDIFRSEIEEKRFTKGKNKNKNKGASSRG